MKDQTDRMSEQKSHQLEKLCKNVVVKSIVSENNCASSSCDASSGMILSEIMRLFLLLTAFVLFVNFGSDYRCSVEDYEGDSVAVKSFLWSVGSSHVIVVRVHNGKWSWYSCLSEVGRECCT